MKLRADLPAGLVCLWVAACMGADPAGSAPCEDSILLDDQDIVLPEDPAEVPSTSGAGALSCEQVLTDGVPGPPVAWTIELERGDSSPAGALELGEDVLVVSADSKLWGLELDDGSVRWGPIPTTMNLRPANLDILDDGRLVVGDRFGSQSAEYLVFDAATGAQLDQLPLDDNVFNWPMVVGDGDRFWLGMYTRDSDSFEIVLNLRRYDPSVAEFDWELLIPDQELGGDTVASMALDDSGRLALVARQLYIIDLETGVTTLGSSLASTWADDVLGLDTGWAAIGGSKEGQNITRVDGEGETLWELALPTWPQYSWAPIARRPEGGLVVVGREQVREDLDRQPAILVLDGDGEPEYGERIAAVGRAAAVAVGREGEIYVSGDAVVDHFTGGTEALRWVRRYEP